MTNTNFSFTHLSAACLLLFLANANAAAADTKQVPVGAKLILPNKPVDSAVVLQKMLENDPNNARLWQAYGNALDMQNESKEAIEAYTKAITLGRRQWDIYHGRGMAYSHIGDFDKAISDFTASLQAGVPIPSSLAAVYCDRADAELESKHFSAAAPDYSKYLTILSSPDPTRLTHRARAYAGCGKIHEAIDDMSKYLQAHGPKPRQKVGGYLYRSELYVRIKQYDKAIADLSAALTLDPDRSSIFRARAQLYDLTGKANLADKDRATAKQLDYKLYGER